MSPCRPGPSAGVPRTVASLRPSGQPPHDTRTRTLSPPLLPRPDTLEQRRGGWVWVPAGQIFEVRPSGVGTSPPGSVGAGEDRWWDKRG